MYRLLTGVALLGMMLTAAVLLVMAAGGAQAADPLLAETEDCRWPCWQGITPGESTFPQADLILTQMGYRNQDNEVPTILTYTASDQPVCEVTIGRNTSADIIVRELFLTLCDALSVGDVMVAHSLPERLSTRFSIYMFAGSTITIFTHGDLCQTQIAPHDTIAQIRLTPPIGPQQFYELDWQGFLPLWRYDQLNPDGLICP